MVALLTLLRTLHGKHCGTLRQQQEITRQMQDEFALRSQQAADAAYKDGRMQEELVPVALRNSKGELTGEILPRTHRRPQTTIGGSAKSRRRFGLPPENGDGHRGKRQWNRGRRRRGRGDVGGAGAKTRSEPVGTDCELGHRGRRSPGDGTRPGAGNQARPATRRADLGIH